MGKQSRLRRERREERAFDKRFDGVPVPGAPLRILRSLHKTIQDHCGESGRRCWEYTLEILALSSGWPTESNESQHLWEKVGRDPRWVEYVQAWYHEVKHAKATGGAFSEPLGELLEEIESTNTHLGQYFTPMAVVRMINSINFNDLDGTVPDGEMPSFRGLDPCCGTGRFMIDALVHHDNIMMHGVDTDIWMVRAAMLNVRLLAPYTSLRLKDPGDRLRPLRRAQKAIESMVAELERRPDRITEGDLDALDALLQPNEPYRKHEKHILMIGGRAIFIHGDALVVDLDYTNNWLCAGWAWKPHPWQSNLKMAGYHGTYQSWIDAGKPTADQLKQEYATEIQFDYSMAKKDTLGGRGDTNERRRSV